jgi:hypothetical protein
MKEIQEQCYLVGIPLKTRHREVAPNQYEFAPCFGPVQQQIDQNLVAMQISDEVAPKHGLRAIFHEKPFQGVNGSGKHNNWCVPEHDVCARCMIYYVLDVCARHMCSMYVIDVLIDHTTIYSPVRVLILCDFICASRLWKFDLSREIVQGKERLGQAHQLVLMIRSTPAISVVSNMASSRASEERLWTLISYASRMSCWSSYAYQPVRMFRSTHRNIGCIYTALSRTSEERLRTLVSFTSRMSCWSSYAYHPHIVHSLKPLRVLCIGLATHLVRFCASGFAN